MHSFSVRLFVQFAVLAITKTYRIADRATFIDCFIKIVWLSDEKSAEMVKDSHSKIHFVLNNFYGLTTATEPWHDSESRNGQRERRGRGGLVIKSTSRWYFIPKTNEKIKWSHYT